MSGPHATSQIAGPRWSAAGLACRRGNALLFKGLDIDVGPGQIVWVRGQNGRGKTSLLEIAAGLSTPERGQISSDGIRRVVYIGHANALKDDLTAGEALEFLLKIQGRPCGRAIIDSALHAFGMHSRRDAMVRTLSQGQRRRVALARLAVETQASLWILDEPYDVLDADGVRRLNQLLDEHVQRGGSVLLASHQAVDTTSLQLREVDLDRYC